MKAEPVRVGMIGAGFIAGDYHLPALQAAGAEVVVVADPIGERAAEKARRFGIAHHTTDYREALGRGDIEAVVIGTPDYTHMEVAIAALRAKKAVLLQKPMARNSAECRAILAAAAETGTPLYVSFMHRYMDETVKLQELLAANAIGRVYFVRQTNAHPTIDWAGWFYSQECVGGGVVNQLGVHGIYLVSGLFGEIETVKADVRQVQYERRLADGTVVPQDNDDLAMAVYRLRNGMMVSHEINFNEAAGTARFRMEVHGLQGSIYVRTERGPLAVYAPEYTGKKEWVQPEMETTFYGLRHHRHFLDMVRGAEPPDRSALEGFAYVRVAEAIYRSAASGAWEAVQPA